MDQLPDSVLLHILSLLDDSADVARCRVASKAFDTVFPGLRSINLQCSAKWYWSTTSRGSDSPSPWVSESSSPYFIKPFKMVFLDLISKLETVESVCIGFESALQNNLYCESDDCTLTNGDFVNEWLPRVSGSLKTLSIDDHRSPHPSNVLPLISAYCHNLLRLEMQFVYLSGSNMNPMPMLTSLALWLTDLEDEQLNDFDKWFPNLQVLTMSDVRGLRDPMIHLLNLKTCIWYASENLGSLTLITPNLITLKFTSGEHDALHVEAPMLSEFHLGRYASEHVDTLTVVGKFENLKTLSLDSVYIGSLLSEFLLKKTVENLTLDSSNGPPRDTTYSKLTLRKVFTVFPSLSSLCIKSSVWSELEACLNSEGWEILDGREGLRTIRVYLKLVDLSLTFSSVARVLDQCVGLSEASFLIHTKVKDTVSESFMSKCMAQWPGLKWRWGTWSEYKEDSWITDGSSIEHHKSSKKRHL